MKKICFVLTTPFAANAFLLGHLQALADRYDVALCLNRSAYPLSNRLDPRVRVIDIPMARKMAPLADLRALVRLVALFRAERFDAVHSVTPKAGLLAMLAAFLTRVPYRFHTFTGQVWATKAGWGRAFFKNIDRCIVACATRVFSDSKSQSAFLEREGIGGATGISILGDGSIAGVSPLRFRPNPEARRDVRAMLGVGDDCCVFLFVGRIARDKGVFDLIHAYRALGERRRDVALVVVGPDEEGLQSCLIEAAGGTAAAIHWIGASFEPETYMAGVDLLILPSYREGFGLVVIEAAACEIPALAYRIDGIVDAVVDGETGCLVDPENKDQLAAMMETLADRADLRKRLGRRARQRVLDKFSDAAVTSAWLAFYDQALGSE